MCENLISGDEMNLFYRKLAKNIGLVWFCISSTITLDFGVNRIHFTENARASLDLESTTEMVLLNRLQLI
jgi:hypothetical protein